MKLPLMQDDFCPYTVHVSYGNSSNVKGSLSIAIADQPMNIPEPEPGHAHPLAPTRQHSSLTCSKKNRPWAEDCATCKVQNEFGPVKINDCCFYFADKSK